MIIYQSAKLGTEQDKLNRLVVELAKYLIPHARILDSEASNESVKLLLREVSALTAFNLYNKELREQAFENVLKTASELESKRREQDQPLLKEIGFYLLARGFSSDFLRRAPFELAGIRLFEWNFIRSEANDAVFIREVSKTAPSEKISNELSQAAPFEYLPKSRHFPHQELSTSELVAFARLGMELRSHRAQKTSSF